MAEVGWGAVISRVSSQKKLKVAVGETRRSWGHEKNAGDTIAMMLLR